MRRRWRFLHVVEWAVALAVAAAALWMAFGGRIGRLRMLSGRDVVVSRPAGATLGRVVRPGDHRIQVPCSHVPGQQGTLTVQVTPRDQTGGEPGWDVAFRWNGRQVAALSRAGLTIVTVPCPHGGPDGEKLMLELREFKVAELRVGGYPVMAEVADTPRARSYGLQGRSGLPPDYGMWFIFDRPFRAVFVMKTVSFPLSVAFVRADGGIVGIERLSPGDARRATATEPVLYALEMPQGWFEEHGVVPGSRVEFPAPD